MKTSMRLGVVVGAMALTGVVALRAAESGTAAPPAPYVTQMLGDVVKMSQAGVSEDVLRTYVDSARSASQLSPEAIVYAREQNVPNSVINAIMQKSAQPASAAVAVPPAPAPAAVPASTPAVSQTFYAAPQQTVVTYAQPAVVYVRPAPVYVASPGVNYGFGFSYGFQPYYHAQHYRYHHWPRTYPVYAGVGFHFGYGRYW